MSTQKKPLSRTEAAFVQMVLDEHRARVGIADQKRDDRMRVLLGEKDIPNGVPVQFTVDGDQAFLCYDVAEMAVAE